MTKQIEKQTTTRGNILLVEDDQTYATSLLKVLKRLDFEVVHVDCYNHAMRKLDSRIGGDENFDCIILDYDLSKSESFPNGPNSSEIMCALKYIFEEIPPVIANSGDDWGNDQLKNLDRKSKKRLEFSQGAFCV